MGVPQKHILRCAAAIVFSIIWLVILSPLLHEFTKKDETRLLSSRELLLLLLFRSPAGTHGSRSHGFQQDLDPRGIHGCQQDIGCLVGYRVLQDQIYPLLNGPLFCLHMGRRRRLHYRGHETMTLFQKGPQRHCQGRNCLGLKLDAQLIPKLCHILQILQCLGMPYKERQERFGMCQDTHSQTGDHTLKQDGTVPADPIDCMGLF
mmetsp:Transcript_16925/g.39037  ORF Transcript_16925/g.39037 Transcript_16925/m.39037 type:complete len:205 (-) Transcript_16925:2442-3056(-)